MAELPVTGRKLDDLKQILGDGRVVAAVGGSNELTRIQQGVPDAEYESLDPVAIVGFQVGA